MRLRSTIVYPNVLQLGKDFWSLSRQVDVPMSKITRRIVVNALAIKGLWPISVALFLCM